MIGAILALIVASAAPTVPDPALTPGVRNPDVTQANIDQTICKSGWTATVRPPVSWTNKVKAEQMAARGLAGPLSAWELDHLLAIENSGAPRDVHNLWMEPWLGPCGAHRKDVIETHMKRMICAHQITLADAQTEMLADWREAYRKHVGPLDCSTPKGN